MKAAMARRLAALEAAAKRQDDRIGREHHELPLHFWIVTGHPPGGYDNRRSMADNLGRSIGIEQGLHEAMAADWPGVAVRIKDRFVTLMRERGAVLPDDPDPAEVATDANWAIVAGLFADIPETFARTLPFPELADYRL